ncbi:hypothetical protein [Anatilimnocola aggregata]|uniref:hypothetical protein n=1 Tax=Anatilimnocola aggregata TaxID=2528021 RepID=UPI0011A72CF7|nr:hypothetical protein [Anatilimnocola aggregata]
MTNLAADIVWALPVHSSLGDGALFFDFPISLRAALANFESRSVPETVATFFEPFRGSGWQCIHRHLYVTILSALFCARVRQKLSPSNPETSGELLTLEHVRRAADVLLDTLDLPPKQRQQRYTAELAPQTHYQRRRLNLAS